MKNLPLILSVVALLISLLAAGYSHQAKDYAEMNGATFELVGMAQTKDGERLLYMPVYKRTTK